MHTDSLNLPQPFVPSGQHQLPPLRISSVKAASDHLRALDPVMQTTIVTGTALLLCLIPALGEGRSVP